MWKVLSQIRVLQEALETAFNLQTKWNNKMFKYFYVRASLTPFTLALQEESRDQWLIHYEHTFRGKEKPAWLLRNLR